MKSDNLDSRVNFSELELDRSRRELYNTGAILHFAGEAGLIYYTGFKGIVLTIIQNWNSESGLEVNLGNVGLGLGIYVLTQIPAFYLKFISQTNEEHRKLSEKLQRDATEREQKRLPLSSWLDTKLGRVYDYLANHPAVVEDRVKRYTLMRRKVIG
ncbi:MAG: hypothetical protein WCV90_00310 [Candidatus Woesearchaeota archaeon]|jgi:hypothetical protein